MAEAARACGRDPKTIGLTAVSKQQAWEAVAPVLAAGQRVFGENRVQEAMSRWGERRDGVVLHLIGPLQTNKAADAVAFFDVIETLDRERLARAPRRRDVETGPVAAPADPGQHRRGGAKGGRAAARSRRLPRRRRRTGTASEPVGLMCIPPADEPPGPHFAMLAKIARRNGLAALSMGMSSDFEIAIRHGATARPRGLGPVRRASPRPLIGSVYA